MAKANKKTYNFNAIRPLIVIMHNRGNTKAITKDMVDGADIDIEFFNEWVKDCNALREVTLDYVTKKKNARFDTSITEGDIYAAKNRIYPKWKEILHCGEEDKVARELCVKESDIEDLIGFSWDFFATTNGTTESGVSQQMFRRKVESLLGCVIARNTMLSDEDRETLDAYYKASKRVKNCIEQLANLKTEVANWELMKSNPQYAQETQFMSFIDKKLKELEEQKKSINESKANAEKTEKEYSTKAKEIESRINKIS